MLVRYVIILEFCNHPYDYRPNRTPLSPITIINNIWMAPGKNHITAISTEIFFDCFFLPWSTGFLISSVSKFSIFQEERSNWVCVWGGGGGGKRELQGCLSSIFFLLLGKNRKKGWLAKVGWILTYLKISVEMVVTWFLPGAIQFPSTWILIAIQIA